MFKALCRRGTEKTPPRLPGVLGERFLPACPASSRGPEAGACAWPPGPARQSGPRGRRLRAVGRPGPRAAALPAPHPRVTSGPSAPRAAPARPRPGPLWSPAASARRRGGSAFLRVEQQLSLKAAGPAQPGPPVPGPCGARPASQGGPPKGCGRASGTWPGPLPRLAAGPRPGRGATAADPSPGSEAGAGGDRSELPARGGGGGGAPGGPSRCVGLPLALVIELVQAACPAWTPARDLQKSCKIVWRVPKYSSLLFT
nr:uncharacterized protein LOC116156305 [Camelus dromedarius]